MTFTIISEGTMNLLKINNNNGQLEMLTFVFEKNCYYKRKCFKRKRNLYTNKICESYKLEIRKKMIAYAHIHL